MKVKVVQELKPYSYHQIMKWLGQGENTSDNIIKSLIVMNILKKLSSNVGKLELENLLDLEELDEIEDSINKNMYVFKYVGMVMIGQVCFFVYPKYINNIDRDVDDGYRKFKQILSVIRKYQSKEQIQTVTGNKDITEFNMLSFTLDLLQDYHENGIYSNDKTIIEANGYGEILWEKTINEQNVYFSNSVPVYLDLYTVTDVLNEEDIFRRLHRSIITGCCKEIKAILEVLDIPPVIISDERMEDFGNEEYIKYKLKQEITQQFITRKQEVLFRMLSYIEREENHRSNEEISFVGTNSFDRVWEDVCACVMDDCLNKTLSEIGLKPYGDIKDSDMVINVIPKPKWKHNRSNKIHEAKKTLIPDLISIQDGKLSIYDAKYYKIRLDENGVSHQPGVGDVTKQYLYELAYRKLAEENKLDIDRNAFLMPSDEETEEIIGVASLELFSTYGLGQTFNDIEVVLKPSVMMFDKYLEV